MSGILCACLYTRIHIFQVKAHLLIYESIEGEGTLQTVSQILRPSQHISSLSACFSYQPRHSHKLFRKPRQFIQRGAVII